MDFFLILSIVFTILGACYLYKRRNPSETEGIPWKSWIPLLGSTWESIITKKPFAVVVQDIYNLSPTARYVGFYNRMSPVVMIRDPELIKSIGVKNFDHFRNHRNFGNNQLDSFLGNNLLLLRDDRWKEIRSLITPAFTSSKLRSMFPLMSETAMNVAKYLSHLPPDQNVEMKDVFTRYANDVFATCAFGIATNSLTDRENKFYSLGREALDIHSVSIVKFLMLRLFPSLSKKLGLTLLSKQVTDFFKEVVRDNIKVREEQGIVRPDFIQLMMETRHKLGPGKELTVEDITGQAFVFFFGGFETTSSLLCFAAHELAANPDLQEKLHAEIDSVLEDTGGEMTLERLNSLEYLDAVINETLRMYPIIPITDRECSQRFELPATLPGTKPYVLQEGSHVWFPIYAIHRDPRYFHRPDNFNPDRFLDRRNNIAAGGSYLPFGIGPRNCIGNRFSLVEIKVAIFYILARCRFKVCSETTLPMKLKKRGVFLMARNGFWLRIEARKNPFCFTK